MDETLRQSAIELVALLSTLGRRIVFAESCTCGLAAAAMGTVPGVSHFFCGSQVVYRVDSKERWLQVPSATIRDHSAQSVRCSEALARGILSATPEADLAIAITGDLGPIVSPPVSPHPTAPPLRLSQTDGVVHLAWAVPVSTNIAVGSVALDHLTLCLVTGTRVERQIEAATLLIRQATQILSR